MENKEDLLRTKIQSKMTVATFLAGFTFAALLELVKDRSLFDLDKTGNYSLIPIRVAVTSLTLALALFISAVYMYDRMTMPGDFWKYELRSDPISNGRKGIVRWLYNLPLSLHFRLISKADLAKEGVLYTYMIWTWNYVFTPAVVCALTGFCAILYNLSDTWVFYPALTSILLISIYYMVARPRLGVD